MPLHIFLTLLLTAIGLAGLTVALLFSGTVPALAGVVFLAAAAVVRLWGRHGA
jgi:hypothetical protein